MSAATPRPGWAERCVLLLWRLFPRRARERHTLGVARTLREIRAAKRAPRQARGSGDSARSGASDRHLVIDTLATLARAWAVEVGDRIGNRWDRGSPSLGRGQKLARVARFSGLGQDLRHATRALSRSAGFTAVAVITLGLGIGATSTFFTLVDGILLDPLPYAEPSRLVKLKVARDAPLPGANAYGESYPDLLDLRRDNRVFKSLAGFVREEVVLMAGDEPLRIDARFAEPVLFSLMGVPAAMGRMLAPGDRDAIVLGDRLWRSHFGADRDVIGTTLTMDGRPYVVVGVMPPGFFVEGVTPRNDLATAWVPLSSTTSDTLDYRRIHVLDTFGRLADGVTLEQAQQAMDLASASLHGESEFDFIRDLRIWVAPLHREVIGDAGRTLWLLLGAVGFLLLITCANVANLQLARLSFRFRETAVRRALGAGRMRIVRQLLAESVILALLGGAAGLLLTIAALRVFVAFSPGDLPRLDGVDLDAGVFAFALAASLATGVLFGLAPALRGGSTSASGALREGGRGASGGLGARRLRNGLLVGELALAVVLLAGAGLMVSSFNYLRTYELGFDPSNVLTLRLDLSGETYNHLGERVDIQTQLARVRDFHRRLYASLKEIPGVEAVAGTPVFPSSPRTMTMRVYLEERPDEELLPNGRVIGGDYFEVLRLPLLAGRRLETYWDDGEQTEVMVNAAAVRELWPGLSMQGVLGRRLKLGHPSQPWSEVVGVIGDVRHRGLDPAPRPEIVRAQGETVAPENYFLIRSHGDPLALVPRVREAVWALDPELPIEEIRTLEQAIAATMAGPRFYALLFSIFGALAITLAALGVASVAAYSVAAQTREIGVRMALGASPASVLRKVLADGAALVVLGIGLGLMATWWAGRLLEGFLYGVTPMDTPTLTSVCGALVLVALVAIALPARRAASVDPVRVLRDG